MSLNARLKRPSSTFASRYASVNRTEAKLAAFKRLRHRAPRTSLNWREATASSSSDSPVNRPRAQSLQIVRHAFREHGEIRNEGCVADDVEVQLACVRQHPHVEWNVPLDDAELEPLEDPGAGEVHRLRGTGKVAHQQIDQPLAIHDANQPPLQITPRGLVGREAFGSAVALAICSSRRIGSSSPKGSGTMSTPTRFPA